MIPAHLASVRFPGKILFPFHGLAMIEHVRRRALMCEALKDVIVATCDEEIASVVRTHGGHVIMTDSSHTNGTTRVAEVARGLDCSHVMLLQGDEPLLLPRHLDACVAAVNGDPDVDAWNATGPIEHADELDRHSFVKCSVATSGRILHCFRRSPFYSGVEVQREFVRKILGIVVYRRAFLADLTALPPAAIEQAEFIEQMRIIENERILMSVPVSPSLPSVNEPEEAEVVLDYIQRTSEQRTLLSAVLGGSDMPGLVTPVPLGRRDSGTESR